MIKLAEKTAAWRRRVRRRAAAQDGLTLVEVLVTALMIGLIGFTFVGLDAANQTTADQRARAKAFGVAQADQERIKGLSADQIAILNQTRTVTSDGTPYTVTSVGKFISSSSAADSCASAGAAADYAKVTTTVNWTDNSRTPVSIQSVISPAGRRLGRRPDARSDGRPARRILDRRHRQRPEHRFDSPRRNH